MSRILDYQAQLRGESAVQLAERLTDLLVIAAGSRERDRPDMEILATEQEMRRRGLVDEVQQARERAKAKR